MTEITLNKYDYHSSTWWKGKKACITKSYTNASGQIIEKDSLVNIQFKLEKLNRQNNLIHRGFFFVEDKNGICIGGVYCEDLILLTEFIKPLSICLN